MSKAKPRAATAQITLQGRQSLVFGVTLPGVNKAIAPANALSAGQFYLLEHLGGVVKLTFTLPANLVKAGGGNLLITFAATDALYRTTGSGATSTVFNPKVAKTVTLSSSRIRKALASRPAPRTTSWTAPREAAKRTASSIVAVRSAT